MSRFLRLYSTICLFFALACFSVSALAGGPVFWEISKQSDVLKGDARGVSIADNGTITLAPTYTLFYDTKEAYIWSSAVDSAGNIYLGTGHDGKIFKVDASGAGRLLYDAQELDVTALATDPAGNLYAATSPEGKIYKIPPGGTATVFFDPDYKYIWSLLYDNATSTLYAGTGDKGVIYKIDANGKEKIIADTNESNIVSLALDRSGNLIAGTDPAGLVLRISPDGKTFALLDTPAQEIHALTVTPDGSIYALGINQQGAAQKTTSVGTASTSTLTSEGVIKLSTDDDASVTVQSVEISPAGGSAATRSKADNAKSSVFRVLPDGGSELVWSSNDVIGFALKVLSNNNILIGTGSKGRIYSIAPDRSQTLLIQSPEDQTSMILAAGENLFAASSNLGRLYRIGSQPVSEGTYISTVRDTRFAGQWGVINWRGSGVQVQTRTGNTETPDLTWSDWSPAYSKSDGDMITSPRARFIQWKATLKNTAATGSRSTSANSNARLEAVTVAYLPRNQAPDIASVSVLPAGVALAELPSGVDPSILSSGLDPALFGLATNLPPRRFFQKGARTITWAASDANDDDLLYQLYYKTLGDNQWHLLADRLTQNYYTIDGNRLADGSYHFKVVATDAPGNPDGTALTNEQSTSTVEIDNTPPAINPGSPRATGAATEVTFEVTDATSRIIKGEYSIDGGEWRLVFPADGIADSAKERFNVRVTIDKPGEHVVAFRVADSSSNVGTSKVTVTK